MTEERKVHPDCRNVANPYHECSEYCFKDIAEAKKRRADEQGYFLIRFKRYCSFDSLS